MAELDIDFEGTGGQGQQSSPGSTTSTNNQTVVNQEDTTALNGGGEEDVTGRDGSSTTNTTSVGDDSTDDNPSTGELAAGDTVEVDGVVYTVAENGDLVDDKGVVFKEAKDIKEWLKSVDVEDDSETQPLTLASIQECLGVTITDENGNNVEFTDDVEGVRSYIDSVISIRSNELQQAAINRLYKDNPLLKQFQDYVQVTGSPRGFGEMPDRSGIELDKNNENQLRAVIKMAAQEFGNKSLNDNYLDYLRDSGGLYDEAKNQLAALVEKDEAYRKEIEKEAKAQRDAEAQATANYWNNVNKIITSRQIGGYRIPESFTKEQEGKKIVVTPNDFYNYLANPIKNEDGRVATAYQHDLAALTDDEYLNREILDAWLMFTGGTYKDLIDMAVKEEQVRQLRVKSKDRRSAKTVKVIKNTAGKTSIDDIIL